MRRKGVPELVPELRVVGGYRYPLPCNQNMSDSDGLRGGAIEGDGRGQST